MFQADLLGIDFNVYPEPLNSRDNFTVDFEVENQGDATSQSFVVDFYISTNDFISIFDKYLGSYTINGLGTNSSTGSLTKSLFLPNFSDSFWDEDQTYYIGMLIDANYNVSESDEFNNDNQGEFFDYDELIIQTTFQADLLGKYFNVYPEPLNAGDNFTVDFEVENQGGLISQSFVVDFYISTNDYISTLDKYLDSYTINGLGANSSTGSLTKSLSLPNFSDSFWDEDRTYYIGMLIDANYNVSESDESNNKNRGELLDYDGLTIQTTPNPEADLTPYKPSTWDDKIVVSKVQNTTTDADIITTNDTLYLDWAYLNQGEANTSSNNIITRLLIDGVEIKTWTRSSSLPSNYYTWVDDIEIDPLTVGNHTIRLEVDSNNSESESDENNNVYEKVITVVNPPQSELTPYKPSTWDDKIVISTVKETRTDAHEITPLDTIYVDWAYINQGESDTVSNYSTRLLLDGVEIASWNRNSTNPLKVNYYSYVTDKEIAPLSAGNHTLRLEVDYNNQEAEGNENNNVFEKSFTVVSNATKPDLTPYKPNGWSDAIVISTVTGTNTTASQFTTDDNIYVDVAHLNQGEGATNGQYKTRLLLNGQVIQDWTRNTALNPNEDILPTDINLGKLNAGTHKLTLDVDYEKTQTESNESNNIFKKSFTVTSTNSGGITSTNNAGFDLIDLDKLRSDPLYQDIDGSGLSVVVIDTGLFGSHLDLVDNFEVFVNVSGDTIVEILDPNQSYDSASHGTHVAGTVGSSNPKIGVATDVGLIGINLLEKFSSTSLNNTFQWILDNYQEYNIVAVNMSLGYEQTYLQNPSQASNLAIWQTYIDNLEQNGITVVTSTGNDYYGYEQEGISVPAIFSTLNVGGVWQANDGSNWQWENGAIDKTTDLDRIMAMSQRLDVSGTYDDTIFAPGAYINSTIPDNKQGGKAGTSMASPHVAGVVALMQDAAIKFGGNLLEPDIISQILHDTADEIFDGDDEHVNVTNTNKTYRRVNAYNAVEAVRLYFEKFTPLGALADSNGTFDGAIITTSLDGNTIKSLNGAIGIDGIDLDIGPTDVDLFQFTVVSPGEVTIELKASNRSSQFVPLSDGFSALSEDNTPNLQDVDTLLRLFDSDKNEIGFDDNGGEGSFSKLVQSLQEGIYYAGVSGAGNDNYDPNKANSGDAGATGNYNITFSLNNDDPTGLIAGAIDINLGNYNDPYVFKGELGKDDNTTVKLSDVDLFKVVAPDNGQLLIDIDTPYTDNFANTFLRVFQADGTELFVNDNGRFSSNVLLEGLETVDETQSELVFEDNKFVGHYKDSFLSANVQRGETYYLGISDPLNSAYNPNNFDNRPELGLDDFYDLIINFVNNDLNGTITQARNDIPLPLNNTTRFIGKDENPNDGSLVNVGDLDVDIVKINSATAGILEIDALSSETDAVNLVSTIFAQDGKILARNNDENNNNSLLQFEIEANTNYFVAISDAGNNNFDPFLLGSGSAGDTGEYKLNVSLRNTSDFVKLSDNGLNFDGVQTIAHGDNLLGNIGEDKHFVIGADDIDIYKLVPDTDGKFSIRTISNQQFSADTFLRFFDAEGNEIAFNDDEDDTTIGSFLQVNVTAGNTYYIGVNGYSENARDYNPFTGENSAPGSQGSYTLSLSQEDDPSIPVNNPDTTVLDDPLFRFRNEIVSGTYLFAGEEESQSIRSNFSPPFIEEGQAFKVSLEQNDDLVRFNRFSNNQVQGTYLYANEEESVSIRENFSDVFTEEGTAFYTFGADANMGQDVIRFRNKNVSGTYLFVLGEEANSVRSNFSDVFEEEGVAFEVAV